MSTCLTIKDLVATYFEEADVPSRIRLLEHLQDCERCDGLWMEIDAFASLNKLCIRVSLQRHELLAPPSVGTDSDLQELRAHATGCEICQRTLASTAHPWGRLHPDPWIHEDREL